MVFYYFSIFCFSQKCLSQTKKGYHTHGGLCINYKGNTKLQRKRNFQAHLSLVGVPRLSVSHISHTRTAHSHTQICLKKKKNNQKNFSIVNHRPTCETCQRMRLVSWLGDFHVSIKIRNNHRDLLAPTAKSERQTEKGNLSVSSANQMSPCDKN